MVLRVHSIEDGNQQGLSLVSGRRRVYSDIDLTFAQKPDGDVFKKQNVADVKQAVKNLLLTNFGEKPFNPFFGGNLNDFLFELNDGINESDVEDEVRRAIENHEPRAQILDVKAIAMPDNNDIRVTVTFKVVSLDEQVSITVSLARLR